MYFANIDFGNTITVFAYAVGVIGGLGGAVGYFAKGRGDTIIKYQTNEITLRDGTITRLEKEKSALSAENKLLKDQNAKLSDLAQGNPQLIKLTSAIEALTLTVQNDKKRGKR